MYIPRSIILLVLGLYIFFPTAFNWMLNPEGSWYRPYLIWATVVATAFLLQLNRNKNDI